MADRYWIGGTGTWNTTSTTNWSSTPTGGGGAPVPTSADNVFFGDNSSLSGATITLSGAINCLTFNFTSSTACTISGTSFTLGCFGSFTISNGSVNFAATGTINSTGSNSRFFNVACSILNVNVQFLTGGSVGLSNNVSCLSINIAIPTNFNGYSITASSNGTVSVTTANLTSILLLTPALSIASGGTFDFSSGTLRTNTLNLSGTTTFIYSNPAILIGYDGVSPLTSITQTNGTVTLNGAVALSNTSTYTLSAGTLNLGGDLTVGIFASNSSSGRTINFSTYNIILAHTTAAQVVLSMATMTGFTWTGTGGFVSNAAVTRTYTVATTAFPSAFTSLPNLSIISGSAVPTFTNNSGFNTLNFTGSSVTSTSATTVQVSSAILSSGGTFTSLSINMIGIGSLTSNGKTISSFSIGSSAVATLADAMSCSAATIGTSTLDSSGYSITCAGTISFNGNPGGVLVNTGTITCATWLVQFGIFNFTNGTINPSVSFVLTSGTFNYNGGTLGPVPTFTHTAGTVTLSNSYALTSVGIYTFNGGQLNLGNYTLTTARFNAGTAGTSRSIDFGTSSLLEITGNNATVLSLNQLGSYTGTVKIACTYVGSVGTRTINIGGWTQSTVGTAAFDLKCSSCVGIQIYGSATDTLFVDGTILNFDMTGINFNWNPNTMTVYGDYTIPATGGPGGSFTGTGTTTFASTSATPRTITISRPIDISLTFNGVGGTFQLGANLTVTGLTRIMSLLNGTLSLNGYDLTVGYFSSNNSNTRAINFGANSITINGNVTPWDTTVTTGLTVTGSRTVNVVTAGVGTISVISGTSTEANSFDFNFSGTTTVNFLQNAGFTVRNVNFTGFTGTLNSTAAVTVFGSYTLSAGMTVVASSSIMTFGATSSTNTITTNGKTMPPMIINGIDSTFNLGSTLTSSGALQVLAGTLDTTASNYAITCTSLDSSIGTNTRAINLNGSTVTVSGTAGVTLNEVNLTFTPGTSQLTLNNTTSTVLSVIGSEAFYNVSLTGGAPLVTIVGTNTYNNLTFANGSTVPSVVTITGNQTVGGTLSNTSTNALTRLLLQSSVSGSQIVLSANTESLSNVDFKDVYADGTAIPFVGTRFGNLGNNTNITFDAGVSKYWNLAAGGNWNAVAWATTSGGTPDVNNFPLAQDTCVIQNTGLNTSATITMNGNWVFGTLDMSTRTNAMTLAIGTTSPTVTGNWTNGTGTTLTGTGTVNFRNTGTTQTITASGITFTPNLNYDSNGGTIQLATALTLGATTTFTLTKGTLSLNGFTLTTGIFSSNNSFTRSIAFGTTNIILAHTTAGTNVLDMASLSNFSTSGTGQFTSAMSVTRTFNSGTLSAVTGSLAFNGTSQYAYISYGQGGTNWVGTLDVSSDPIPFTLEAWINLSSTPSGYGTIASLWEAFSNTSKAFAFSVNSSLELTIQTGNAGGVATLSGGAIPLNTWTHVAWVKGSSLQYLYVNGQLVASSVLNPNVASVARDYVIGARYQSGYTSFFSGNISNVRFVNGVEVYTGNFTPSISPLNPTQSSGTNISAITAGQTELLLNTPNNASILADGSINNFILTNAGATTSASTPITSLPAPGTPPSLSLTSGAAIPTLATGSYFTNLNFTGTTSVPAASSITVAGNLTLATGGTYTSLGVTMAGTGTITPIGKTIAAFAVNTTGTVTLAAAFGCTTFNMAAGTLDLASFNLTCSSTATYTSGTLSNLSTITCTTWTTQGTLAHSQGTITPSVSFVITSGSYTQTGTSVLGSVATFTQTAGNVTFRSTYSLTATGTYTLTAGALTLGGNLTTGIFSSNNGNVRSIAFSTFNIVLAHTGLAQVVLAMATLTNFSWTGTGGFASVMAGTRTFQSGTTAGATASTVPNLSLTSGGSIPTITTGGSFNNLNFTGSTSAPASTNLSIYGNLTLASGGTYSTLIVNMVGSAGNVNGAGSVSLLGLNINNNGGTTTLTAALTLLATGVTTLTSGNLNLGGFSLTTGTFVSSSSTVRSITFGTANIFLTTTAAGQTNLSMADATNFTYTSSGTYGSGTGCFRAIMNATRTFNFGTSAGGSATNAPRLSLASGSSLATFASGSWFGELDFGSTAFTIATIALNLVSLKSNFSTSSLLNLTATMVGSGSIQTNTTIGALTINTSGITTTLAGTTRCTTVTLTQGTLDLTTQSLIGSSTFTYNGGSLLMGTGSLSCTTFTLNGPTLELITGTLSPSTSFVLNTGSFTYGGTATFNATATFTQNSGTVTFNKSYALTTTGTYTLATGSLTLSNGVTLSTGIFSSNNSATRSIGFGSSISSGSVSFNGTTQYLTVPSALNGPLDLVTSAPNWTIECWFKLSAIPTSGAIYWKPCGTPNPIGLWVRTGGVLQWLTSDGAAADMTGSLLVGKWYHVAIVRNGSLIKSYLNGALNTSNAIGTLVDDFSSPLYIGNSPDSRIFPGFISNFRVTKGVSVYTGNFEPSHSPLTSTQSAGTNISAITGTQTSLLLNTVDGPNFLTDSSSFNTTVTNVGTSTSSPQYPFIAIINLTSTTAAAVVLNMSDLTNYSYTGPGGFTVDAMGNTRTFTYGNGANGTAATAINLTFTTGASAASITNGSWFNTLDFGSITSVVTGTNINVVGSLFLSGTYTAATINMLGTGSLSGGGSASLLSLAINTVGTITMSGNLTMGGTSTTTLTQGSLVLNGFTLTTGRFVSDGTGFTRSVDFGSTNIVLAHATANQIVLAMGDLTGFTYTGTGGFSSSMAVPRAFTYGTTANGSTSTAINLLITGGASTPTLTSGGWFKNLNFTGSTCVPAATALNITGNLTLATGGTYTGVSVTLLDTSTITPTGRTLASFTVNTANTVTLAGALGCTTYTQTLGTLDFATFNLTCSSTATYTGGTLSNIGTITCTTFTINGPSFTFSSGTITPSVSFVINSGSFTYNSPAVLSAVATFRQTAGNVTLNQAYSLTATGTYILTSGALTLGGNLTTGIFNSSSQLFRSIAFSTFNIVLAHTTAAQTVLNMTDIVNYSQTGTGGFTSAMGVTRTFISGILMGIPGSISFTGANQYLLYNSTAEFEFGTAVDFTFESWVNTAIDATGGALFDITNAAAGATIATFFVLGGQAFWRVSGSDFGTTAVNSIPNNTWTHVVFQRKGTDFEIYINGTLASSYTPITPINMGSSLPRAYLGRDVPGNRYVGRVTNIRLVKNVAVYTGNFTSPTIPLAAAQSADTNISALTGFNTLIMLNATRGNYNYDSSSVGIGFSTSSVTPVTDNSSPFVDAYYGQYPNLSIISGASVPTFNASSLFNTLDFTTSTCTPTGTVSINSLTLSNSALYTGLNVTCVGTGSIIQNNKTLGAFEVKNGYVGGTVTIITNPLAAGSYTQTSGTIDFSSTSLTISGVYTYVAGTQLNLISIIGGTLVVTGTYNFTSGTISPSSITVISPGVFTYGGTATLSGVSTFTQTSGSVTFNKDFALTATGTYTLTSGTLTLGGNLTTGIFSSSNANTRSIVFDTFNIILATTTTAQVNLAMGITTGFTFTGTGGFTAAADITRTFQFGSTTAGGYEPNLTFTGSGTAVQTLTNGSWFKTLNFGSTAFTLPSTNLSLNSLTLSSGGTFTNLSVSMFRTGTITPNGKTIGSLTIINVAGDPTVTTLAGALGCSTYIQTAGTIDFASFNLTCSSTGLFTSGTLSNLGSITCTTFTVAGAFAHTSGTITPSVSFVTTSGSYTQSGTSVLSSVATFTQTAGNVTFRSTYALTATGTYTLTAGTLTLGGDLTTGIFSSTGTGTRAIAFGSYNVVLAHTTAATTVLNMADITNFTPTGTGGFAADASITRTFTSGTTGGSTTNSPNLSLTGSGTAIATFTTNSWFNTLSFGTTAFAAAVVNLNVNGLTLSPSGTYTSLNITAVGTGTFTSNGKTIGMLGIDTLSGVATLADNAAASPNLISGTLDIQSFEFTCTSFTSTSTYARSITGTGTLTITGSGINAFNVTVSGTGLSITGIIINMTSASAKTFAGAGGSYSTLNQGGAGVLTITGNNSFTDITATTRPSTITFTAGSTQTVANFTLSGILGSLVTINSTSPGTQFNLSRASGTTSVGYLNIQDSNATGGAYWYADITSFNVGNNTGWIFTAPPAGIGLGNFFLFF